jgi:acyl-CoA synthetase (AMP-forming)/AMP-acid ligase II
METDERRLLWHSVDYWAERRPEAEALILDDTRLTWREFKEQVDRVAKAFLELGVLKGDRIALISMGRPEFMITWMAASKVGAVWLGVSPKFTTDEMRFLLQHCQPTILITLREYMGIDLVECGVTLRQEFPFIREILVIGQGREGFTEYQSFVDRPRPEWDAPLEQRAAEVREEDETLLMYTSGSTGKPKGVLHTHRSVMCSAAVEGRYVEWTPESRVLLHFPINHVAADVEMGYSGVYAGSTIVFMDRFLPHGSLEMIEKERITHLGQVPAMYLMQMRTSRFAETDWSSMRALVWGAYAAPERVVQALNAVAQKCGARLMTGYGSTEVCGFTTFAMPGDSLDLLTKSAGKILPPYEMKIVDEQRREVPVGEVGEIAFRGPVIMKEYLNNPAATAEVIDQEGWFYTSDLGWVNGDGYLFVCGRRSEMYKTGGENVFPREIEEVIEGHPAVLFAAVVGVSDALYGEVGHAFIMLKPGAEAQEKDLRAHCRQHLVSFKVPKRFDFRPELPLLANGKVNKVALRRLLVSP